MSDESRKPRYRVYRGRRTPGDEALAERLARLAPGAQTPPVRARATPPRASAAPAPQARTGSPVVLPEPGAAPPTRRPPSTPRPAPEPERRRRRLRPGRVIGLLVLLVVVGLAAWIGYGYVRFRDAIAQANHRIDGATRAQLAAHPGSIFSDPTNILVLGSDRRPGEAPGSSRSDSLLLIRSDPSHGQLAYLSIPRDLRVDIPGVGTGKINAAYATGGPALALKTVKALLGAVPIDHVVIVDFAGFRHLIDALGGVTIDNPTKIVSNSFDGFHWRFGKGSLHLDGRHALAYARVRENLLNSGDSDVTRGVRQQRVLGALAQKLASPSTLLHLPSVGQAIGEPLSTDLSAMDLLQLGWRRTRASRTLHCHLGGTPQWYGGQSVLVGGEDNRQTVAMFLGRSAPQPPLPGQPFASGCTLS